MQRYRFIDKYGSDELKERLQRGELTVHAGWKIVKKEVDQRAWEACSRLWALTHNEGTNWSPERVEGGGR